MKRLHSNAFGELRVTILFNAAASLLIFFFYNFMKFTSQTGFDDHGLHLDEWVT